MKTQELKPDCKTVPKYLNKIAVAEKKYLASEKFMCKKMFDSMEDSSTSTNIPDELEVLEFEE